MSESNPRTESLFSAALAFESPEDRAEYLDQECGSDGQLRARVEELLAAFPKVAQFLEAPAAGPGVTLAGPAVAENPGTVIGPYKLLQQIGEGGMGTVFMAEQTQPVQRKVALKLIKPGMDSRQVIARFEAERQALALMDHPNIAKVLDAGTTGEVASGQWPVTSAAESAALATGHWPLATAGRPYFVMELVKGVPITRFCDEHHLTPRQRLELFVPVCQAVQHAHQKGIIHRDLKPSNVMVCLYDGKPVPKVIDFGVAKAAGSRLTEKTLFTELGQVVGTLEYMSPEQAELNQLDIDTRSDIYSLGVLLYELLTGTTPLERKRFQAVAFLEVLRLIREEESPKPSTRLSTTDGLPSIAANRGLEPKKLSGLMRGELDWIVMKALEKERNRRYETAAGLAMDLQRYLTDEPVTAGPQNAAYRLKKFVRRHRGPVLAAAAVLLALVAGIIGTTVGLVRAERARHEAEAAEQQERDQRQAAEEARNQEATERARAEANEKRADQEKQVAQAVRDFLQKKLLLQVDTRQQAFALLETGRAPGEAKENPTVRVLLDRAARELTPDKIESQFPKQPLVQTEILQTIGDAYLAIGEFGPAIAHLKRANDLRRQQLGPEHPGTLLGLYSLARAYRDDGKPAEAIRLLEQVQDKLVDRLDPDHPELVSTLHCLATAYCVEGKLPQAIRLLEQVRDKQLANPGPDDPATLGTLDSLALAYRDAGRTAEAIRLLEQVRDRRIAKFGADHPDTVNTLHYLAGAYYSDGKWAEAVRLYEQVRDKRAEHYDPDHPATLATLNNLGLAYLKVGETAKATRLLEQVRDKRLAKYGADHPDTVNTTYNLAEAYRHAGKTSEAIRLYEQVREKRLAIQGLDHPWTLETLHSLALAYYAAGNNAKAIDLLEQVREKRIVKPGLDHPDTQATLQSLATVYASAQQYDRAIPLLEKLLEKRRAKPGADHPDTLTTMADLAVNYREAGRWPEAVPLMEEALNGARKLPGPTRLPFSAFPREMAETYDRAGQFAKSETLYREFLDQARQQFGAEHLQTAHAVVPVGWNLLRQKKYGDAEPVLRQALAIYAKKAPDFWAMFCTESLLGGALLSQDKYAEAEPLLLDAAAGLKLHRTKIPEAWQGVCLPETLERLVQLYDAWNKKDEAAKWREELEALKRATPPPQPKEK